MQSTVSGQLADDSVSLRNSTTRYLDDHLVVYTQQNGRDALKSKGICLSWHKHTPSYFLSVRRSKQNPNSRLSGSRKPRTQACASTCKGPLRLFKATWTWTSHELSATEIHQLTKWHAVSFQTRTVSPSRRTRPLDHNCAVHVDVAMQTRRRLAKSGSDRVRTDRPIQKIPELSSADFFFTKKLIFQP